MPDNPLPAQQCWEEQAYAALRDIAEANMRARENFKKTLEEMRLVVALEARFKTRQETLAFAKNVCCSDCKTKVDALDFSPASFIIDLGRTG